MFCFETLEHKIGTEAKISKLMPLSLTILGLVLGSCATTLNHGHSLEKGETELTAQTSVMIGGNNIDLQYGLTNEITLGFSVRGQVYPSGEIYGLYGWKNEIFDIAVTGGVLIDPIGYDSENLRRYSPYVSPSASVALSRKIYDWRPYVNLYSDYWRGSLGGGLEYEVKPFTFFLNGLGSYYFNDWGLTHYKGSGIVFAIKSKQITYGILPGISWKF